MRNSLAKKLFGLAALTFSAMVFSGAARAAEAADIYGEWTPPDMDAVISIRDCGEALCAELVDHDYVAVIKRDINNPDPTLRDRPLLGVRILDELRTSGRVKWKGGALYDPRTGKTYFSRVKILDRKRLKITGCIAPRLCKGYVWTRTGP